MEDRLALLSAARPWAMSADEVVAGLDQLQAMAAELEATRLRFVRRAEALAVPRRDGATSMTVWLRNRYRIAIQTARRIVKAAQTVDAAPPVVQEAVAAGVANL